MHHVVVPPIVDQMLALEVHPEKEKPPLQEVVTEEPPGAFLDANSPNLPQTTSKHDMGMGQNLLITFYYIPIIGEIDTH